MRRPLPPELQVGEALGQKDDGPVDRLTRARVDLLGTVRFVSHSECRSEGLHRIYVSFIQGFYPFKGLLHSFAVGARILGRKGMSSGMRATSWRCNADR